MATTTDERDHAGGFGVVDPLARVFAAVSTELGAVADATTWALDDARLPRRLSEALAVQAAADELVARLVGEVDGRDLGGQCGASSTRAHLVASFRMSRRVAGETVARARGFGARTEFTRKACTAGTVSAEQADVIVRAVDKLSPEISDEVVEHAQADLVDHAQTLTFTQLQVVANHLVEVVDPDAADGVLGEQLQAEEARALQQTTFRGRRGFDGVARFSGKMPNLAYDMLTTALEAIASPRRAANHTTAADGSGAGAPLTTGTPVSVSAARRLACNAGVLPAVLGADSAILDLGISDQGCVFPGCERPAAWTEAHHIIPWHDGGPTDINQGCLLCSFHHHLVHQGEWAVQMATDGTPDIVPPARVDPDQEPIRHQRFEPRRE